ncbi:MAG: hypothetical protein F4184_05635 [Gemmatimonadetes bacterium]|nr:hypothetical protein [Gemmatimonadota bacterium]
MINTDQIKTVRAVRELLEEVARSDRRLVYWVGAGASAWAGYPLWNDLSEIAHKTFSRYESGYDAQYGLELLQSGNYPTFFKKIKSASPQRYNRLIKDQFTIREPTPVYSRFLSAISSIQPIRLITTNVDEMLEKGLEGVQTVQRDDIEQILDLNSSDKSYLLKLHGSVSDIESVIFTQSDYDAFWCNSRISDILSKIVVESSLVFIGYSLQDQSVVELLERSDQLRSLLGDGPHFAILPQDNTQLPPSVRIIEYKPIPYKDHRTSITIIEEVAASRRGQDPDYIPQETASNLISAHLLFDIFPPGTWSTSYTAEATSSSGDEVSVTAGLGFKSDELATRQSTALNDLLVGLTCFDVVYAPFNAVARLIKLIGEPTFMQLVKNGVLRFIHWERELVLLFRSKDVLRRGELEPITIYGRENGPPLQAIDYLRRWVTPQTGKESQAEETVEIIANQTITIKQEQEQEIVGRTRSLLISPRIRNMLGVSGGAPLDQITQWNTFPVLRLGHVVKIGTACNLLGLASAKLDFGSSGLAGPAFATSFGQEWSDSVASYVLCGTFSEDLGRLAESDPALIAAVLKLRESAAGLRLREEVMRQIAASEGAEVRASVNAGLRQLLPSSVMDQARRQFVNLYVSPTNLQQPRAMFWNDTRSADQALRLWRERSLRELNEICRKAGISQYDPCPCGSGEKLKFCCEESLRSNL